MSTEIASLAPAAGHGIGKILADRLLADPTFVDSMVNAVLNGLKATRSYWTGKGETAELITEADSKTQLQAFALVLAHMEGEPIKRVIHQHLGNGSEVDPLTALQESPALRDAARALLDKVDTSGGKKRKKLAAAETVTEIE